jgi:hypothetical protein
MGSVTIKTFGARTQKASVFTAIKTQSQTIEEVPLIVDEPGTLQVAGSSRASPWRASAPGTFRDPKAFWATYVAVIADHSRVRRFTRRIRTDLAPNDQQWKPGINGTGFLVRRHGDRGGRPWSQSSPIRCRGSHSYRSHRKLHQFIEAVLRDCRVDSYHRRDNLDSTTHLRCATRIPDDYEPPNRRRLHVHDAQRRRQGAAGRSGRDSAGLRQPVLHHVIDRCHRPGSTPSSGPQLEGMQPECSCGTTGRRDDSHNVQRGETR